jgi:hypothetical protein
VRSKIHRSLKNCMSTCPPKTKNLVACMQTACPYRPAGIWSASVTILDHSKLAEGDERQNDQGLVSDERHKRAEMLRERTHPC